MRSRHGVVLDYANRDYRNTVVWETLLLAIKMRRCLARNHVFFGARYLLCQLK